MSDKRGNPVVLELKSPYTYNKKGNIQLVFDRKKKVLKIHKTIEVQEKKNKNKQKEVGIDKGYHNLLSCSTNKEYGINIAELNGIKVEEINPAYTSKYCNKCGAPIKRKGNHHDIAECPNCGEMDANINAANNILQRLNDTEIEKYTKKAQVKKILDARYENACKNNPKLKKIITK